MHVEAFFERLETAADADARPALVQAGGAAWSYRRLLAETAAWRGRLAGQGVRAGSRVGFAGDFSPAATALLLALFAERAVAVPLPRPAAAHEEREEREGQLALAQVEHLLAIDAADRVSWSARPAGAGHPLFAELARRGEPGLVVFSSASTGAMKAAVHSCERLLGKFRRPRRGLCTLTFLLLDHVGGINTLLHTLANGGTVVPAAERTVDAVCRLIERHRVELLPTTPTFLNMLLIAGAERRYDLSSLRLITFGTEPMPPATLDAVRAAFPAAELKQTYGLTELGVLPTRAAAPGSLWLQVGGEGFATRVEGGTLRVKAESAMLGYLNAPSPFDADGWYDTGDVVEERDGFLRILGRGAEMINVGGEKVAPVEVEDVLLQLDNVRDAAVFGRPNPVTGQLVSARVRLERPEDPAAAERRLRDHCRRLLPPHKVPAVVELVGEPLHGERFKRIRRAAGGRP